MTGTKERAAPSQAAKATPTHNVLQVEQLANKSAERAMAEVGLNPVASAMATTKLFNMGSFGDLHVSETFAALSEQVATFETGDHSRQRAMLVAQSAALNAIFTEMARRAALNMGEYINASERYMRLAFKAQSQCRATIEALDRLANGREQTVRHVHVDNRGGQAVIAETVQTGGTENGKTYEQPHAIEGAGAAFGQPLRSENAQRDAVPLASDA